MDQKWADRRDEDRVDAQCGLQEDAGAAVVGFFELFPNSKDFAGVVPGGVFFLNYKNRS